MVKLTLIVAGLGNIFTALSRAVVAQLHPRMLLLTVMPFVFSVLISALLLWFALPPLNDWINDTLTRSEGLQWTEGLLAWLGVGAIKAVILSMLAMWLLLPVMILTALIFVGTLAMPAISRHVAGKQYPNLTRHHGGSLWGTLWISTLSLFIFIFLWIATLPLSVVPPLTFLIHPALWGWLTYRVMAYDALAEHATSEERRLLMHAHRWPLLLIGVTVGVLGTVPTLLWLGGALSVILLPLLAAGAIWLYVVIFVFSGLWFQYYCLEALQRQRLDNASDNAPGDTPMSAQSPACLTMSSQTIHPADKS